MAKKTLKSAKEKKLPKLRKVGFRNRMKTASGRAVLKRRRARGRKYLTAVDHMRKVNKRPKNKKK